MATPYFLWDYDLTEEDVRRILHGKNRKERQWLIGRLLMHARYEDIWKYIQLKDIVDEFPNLRLRPDIASSWKRALTVWGYHV